ncbi:MAG: hypothetical protein LBH00_08925 [Planctomycetaceae bacterium]|nr:hypothetical protein [Planctomycetaceae bacterium]
MALFRFSVVLVIVLCIGSGIAIADEEPYLTKSEFEQFLQQYRGDHPPVSTGAGKSAWTKGIFTFTPYGFINLDCSYETDKTTSGDYTIWANDRGSKDAPRKSDSGCNIDPKVSRLGVKIESPGLRGWHGSKTEGLVEFDFYGAFQARNRASVRLRRAYVAVSDRNTRLLAGQDWEVISPLFPNTLSSTAGSCVGSLEYRRGMLRIDQRFDFCNGNNLTFQFALVDNVFRDGSSIIPASARYPIIEGRIAYGFGRHASASGKPVIFGVSSHYGEERITFAGKNVTKYMATRSFNADLDMPITKRLTFQMEYFLGENLSSVEGGILQGLDWYREKPIRSQGGWAGLSFQGTDKLQFNSAFLIDDPFNNDVVTGCPDMPGADGVFKSRLYNHCFFINAIYHWNQALMTGFEVDFWRTHWQQADRTGNIVPLAAGESVRCQFTVRYSF